MKRVIIGVVVVTCIFFEGCKESTQSVNWRSDTGPIVRRIPALSTCTNMLWHGEIISNDSFFSIPGPSAYRICCFIPNASQILPILVGMKFSDNKSLDENTFQPVEKAMLKSKYDIDLCNETYIISKQLNRELLQPQYWGDGMFFKAKDFLWIILYGE